MSGATPQRVRRLWPAAMAACCLLAGSASAAVAQTNQRAHYATRILLQNGFTARNISGGTLSRAMIAPRADPELAVV